VLCSVDIAVIVFGMCSSSSSMTARSRLTATMTTEERPGHPVKLHQYCSTNVNNVLQRFVRVSLR
jgi:hypothetical protein